MMTTKEVYALIKDLAKRIKEPDNKSVIDDEGLSSWLYGEGIDSDYVYSNINPEDLIRARFVQVWTWHDDDIEYVLDFLMEKYIDEVNYKEGGEDKVDTKYDDLTEED